MDGFFFFIFFLFPLEFLLFLLIFQSFYKDVPVFLSPGASDEDIKFFLYRMCVSHRKIARLTKKFKDESLSFLFYHHYFFFFFNGSCLCENSYLFFSRRKKDHGRP